MILLVMKAIIFDLGDTVFHSDWKARNEEMLRETGVSSALDDETRPIYEKVSSGVMSIEDFFEFLIKKARAKIDIKKVIEVYKKSYKNSSSINFRMIELIRELRKHFKVYALSNTNSLHKEVNEQRGIFKEFDRTFLSCDMGCRKPEKKIFLEVLNAIKLQPEDVLFIDDNRENIESANNLGVKTFHYNNFEDFERYLKENKIIFT